MLLSYYLMACLVETRANQKYKGHFRLFPHPLQCVMIVQAMLSSITCLSGTTVQTSTFKYYLTGKKSCQ